MGLYSCRQIRPLRKTVPSRVSVGLLALQLFALHLTPSSSLPLPRAFFDLPAGQAMVAAVQANPLIRKLDLRDMHGGFDTDAFATLQCDAGCGNFDIILGHFPHISQSSKLPRARRVTCSSLCPHASHVE